VKHKEEMTLLVLALPSLVGLLGFYVIPFVLSISLAVVDNSVLWNFVWMQNFKEVLSSGAFQTALKNTGIFMALCVPLNMVMPLFIALLLNSTKSLRTSFGVIALIPLVIPTGSTVHFWQSMFGLNGLINSLLFPDNPVNWLNTDYARWIIVFIFIWKNAGYNMVLFLAGLTSIPKEYYECASLEGAGSMRRFFMITLVYLTPTAFLVLVMSIINSFKSFKEIYLLSGEYPHSSIYMLQHYMNNQFGASNYQKLASASYILSIFIVAMVLGLFLGQNKASRYL